MRIVLVCVGKFHDKKKEAGETDEADADVMPIELYHLLCAEFLKREFFLSWAWLTTGWNCVCRHDNIKSLAFHMFNITQDSIKTEFDRTKTSNPGSRMDSSASNPKHLFANTAEPEMCPYLALGMPPPSHSTHAHLPMVRRCPSDWAGEVGR